MERADKGLMTAVRENPALARGVNVWGDRVVHRAVAKSLDEAPTPLEMCLS